MYQHYKQHLAKVEGMDLEPLVKQVIQEEAGRQDGFLNGEDVSTLLSDTDDNSVRTTLTGYPKCTLYKDIASALKQWMLTKRCPILDLKSYDMLDEDAYIETRTVTIEMITPLLEGLQALWDEWCHGEKVFRVRQVMAKLGKRGLLDLLGLRKTAGSVDAWPPTQDILLKTFSQRNKPASLLTVGARALAKHGHRDESSSWWGKSTGTEENKNKHALEVVKRILDGATWINIHELPPQLPVVEVRQENGYGARWSHDGLSFRGFLEPQMQDGHLLGWRH